MNIGEGIANTPIIYSLYQRCLNFETKKEAEKALTALLNEVNEGTYIEPSKQTYREYMDAWLKSKEHDLSVQTLKAYMSYLKTHIIPNLGRLPLATITPLHIQGFISSLRSKGLSETTTKRIFNVVNASLNSAVKLELIKKNPASLIEKPKVAAKETTVWTVKEISLFLEYSKSSPYYTAFLLAVTTGMRQGEVLGLQWRDVDFENECLYIRQTLTHDGKGFKEGAKSKAGNRSIGLDAFTVSALKQQRKTIVANKLKYGSAYGEYDLVACTNKGKPINPRNLLRTFDNIIKKASLPKIRFHDLRHTHASLMLQQGENIKLISERLGHSSVKITLDTYSHVLPNMQKEASNRLAQQLFNS
ncbi:tyrosine-type recombinase/integrase [Bacillus altitudinis]|uniref:tyrosine-type recombinase/integrase n=1 Tax=Bacillus altitudinis TaxID=293387 RepID=UPI00119CD47D|nr:site-specific integrase [Bacillus altitudinis]MBU8967505.1 site-specific integrase [Bacillus altitudinis]MCY7673006.1 site-specific integrase [Bacillus altitudinis]MDR7667634.1 site-specific integrase [Bacillus altitudinis]